MDTLINKIASAKNLDQLCGALNDLESYLGDLNDDCTASAGDCVKLCSLPLFSDNEPADTCEVFSYDDSRCLIQNTSAGDVWVIEDRAE